MRRTEDLSLDKVKHIYHTCSQCLNEKQVKNPDIFRKILDGILCGLLDKQLNDDKFSCTFKEDDLKDFLEFALHLSTTHSLQHPSCLLIIRHLLFKLDKHITNKPRKIENLFKKLIRFNNFIENDHPADIVKDEWLDDYVFAIPSEWVRMNSSDYQILKDNHQPNKWSIYIWSRIVYLSFIKSEMTESNEILVSLDNWLNTTKHNVYVKEDYLTIILVKNIFEIIIQKSINFIFSLPNISTTIQYIFHARDDQCSFINREQVNELNKLFSMNLQIYF
jgi:hypothetical protein